MHEMGIVFSLMDTLRSVMKENAVTDVKSVTIQVGEASLVVPRFMTDCWDAARRKTEFAKTELVIEIVKAEGRCNKCQNVFPIVENNRVCPKCGAADDFTTVTGMDLEIKEIEAA
jgi:hydrogenase nickel incorporation protein HypA/HybF